MRKRRRNLENQPPVVQLLLSEPMVPSWDDQLRRFRKLLPELRRQGEWSLLNFPYVDQTWAKSIRNKFIVTPTGGLNPFTGIGKCREIACRGKAARQFIRSVGLYADAIVVPDSLTHEVVFAERWTEDRIFGFVADWFALQYVAPLIDAEVIRFSAPIHALCSACKKQLDTMIDAVSDEIAQEMIGSIDATVKGNTLTIDTGNLYEPPLLHVLPLRKRDLSRLAKGRSRAALAAEKFRQTLSLDVHDTCFIAADAARLRGVVFSNSRAGMSALRRFDGLYQAGQESEAWELSNSAELPWIRELNAEQIIALRELAADALPRLRVSMRRVTALRGGTISLPQFAQQLREEGAEVESELRQVAKKNGPLFRGAVALAGLSIALYGTTTGSEVVAGMGALINVLQLIHPQSTHKAERLDSLKSKPGYVLVKAKELLEHA